jgi:hypothetical protein
MLSMRINVYKLNISAKSNTIFKNLELQALGTIRIRFLQKSQKKIYACVPLNHRGRSMVFYQVFLLSPLQKL